MSHFPGWNRQTLLILLSLFVVHIVLGETVYDLTVSSDGAEYLQMAQHVRQNGAFTYDGVHPVVGKPPGFSVFLAIYISMIGSIAGIQFVQMAFLFTAYVLVGLIARRFLKQRWTLVLLVVLTVAFPLQALAFNLMAEPLFMVLTMLGFYAIYRSREKWSLRWAIFSGLVFALSTYVRPINLLWPVFMLVLLYFVDSNFRRLAAFTLFMHVLIVTPWIVRNATLFHRFVPMVSNWGPLYFMTNEQHYRLHRTDGIAGIMKTDDYKRLVGDDFQFNWEPSKRLRLASLENIRNDPIGYAVRCLTQEVYAWTYIPGTRDYEIRRPTVFWIGRVLMLVFYLLVAMGAFVLWKDNRIGMSLLVGYAAYSALLLLPVITESRYILPVYLLLLPVALAGTCAIAARLEGRPTHIISGEQSRS